MWVLILTKNSVVDLFNTFFFFQKSLHLGSKKLPASQLYPSVIPLCWTNPENHNTTNYHNTVATSVSILTHVIGPELANQQTERRRIVLNYGNALHCSTKMPSIRTTILQREKYRAEIEGNRSKTRKKGWKKSENPFEVQCYNQNL